MNGSDQLSFGYNRIESSEMEKGNVTNSSDNWSGSLQMKRWDIEKFIQNESSMYVLWNG